MSFAAALLLGSSAVASDEQIALSDFFAIKKVSGGLGIYKWERNDIYVRVDGKDLQYIGTSIGGPPGGVGFLGDAVQDLRAITIAISKDGRSIVFRHSAARAPSASKLEAGIFQYVYGGEIKLMHREAELSGLSYSRLDRAFPGDVLPFQYKLTYTPKDMLWGLRTTGETFPLALLEASPLHWAAFEGRTDECAALIKNGADVNATTYWKFTPLDLAIIRDHQDTAIQLLTFGANSTTGRYPAFHRAVMLGRMKVVQAMLDGGADTNGVDEHGYTPLHLAVFVGSRQVGELGTFFANTETPRSILDKNTSTGLIKLLLERGADPGIRDKSGKTPLEVISKAAPAEAWMLLSDYKRVR
jgi:hypothetical protein